MAALGLTVASARHAGVVIVALVVAVGWSAVIATFDAVLSWSRPAAEPSGSTAESEHASVAFVVSLGGERPDIARTSLLLAAQAGEVHVVATSHHDVVDSLGAADLTEHIAPTIQAAVHLAAAATSADALLLLSASAFPVAATCVTAAARLSDDVGWVTGTAPAFNTDRYAPRERELLSARVRGATRRLGLVTWEPDATIVRTRLLREHPFDPARPFGHWLRARSRDGYRGLSSSEPFSIQAAPTDAPRSLAGANHSPARCRRGSLRRDDGGPIAAPPLRGRMPDARALRLFVLGVARRHRPDRAFGRVPAASRAPRVLQPCRLASPVHVGARAVPRTGSDCTR